METVKYRSYLSCGVILEADDYKWVYTRGMEILRDEVGRAGMDEDYRTEDFLISKRNDDSTYIPVTFVYVSTISVSILDYNTNKKLRISRISKED